MLAAPAAICMKPSLAPCRPCSACAFGSRCGLPARLLLCPHTFPNPPTPASHAGVMGAKHTAALIPLCHNILLSKVHVALSLAPEAAAVDVRAEATTVGPTGVEMEALTAAAVAALTVYDMCKVRGDGCCWQPLLAPQAGCWCCSCCGVGGRPAETTDVAQQRPCPTDALPTFPTRVPPGVRRLNHPPTAAEPALPHACRPPPRVWSSPICACWPRAAARAGTGRQVKPAAAGRERRGRLHAPAMCPNLRQQRRQRRRGGGRAASSGLGSRKGCSTVWERMGP